MDGSLVIFVDVPCYKLQFGHAWAAWMDQSKAKYRILRGSLQFGHAWAAWMDQAAGENTAKAHQSLQFGHAWAAWMDPAAAESSAKPAGASIRPRLGSVDGQDHGTPLLSGLCGASIRPRLGSVDGQGGTNDDPAQ